MDIVFVFRPFSSINPGVFHLALDIFGILAVALCVLLGEVARFGYATGEDSLFLGRNLARMRGLGASVDWSGVITPEKVLLVMALEEKQIP